MIVPTQRARKINFKTAVREIADKIDWKRGNMITTSTYNQWATAARELVLTSSHTNAILYVCIVATRVKIIRSLYQQCPSNKSYFVRVVCFWRVSYTQITSKRRRKSFFNKVHTVKLYIWRLILWSINVIRRLLPDFHNLCYMHSDHSQLESLKLDKNPENYHHRSIPVQLILHFFQSDSTI